MYQETHDLALSAGQEKHPRNYLVMYDTEFEEPLKKPEYLNGVRTTNMFPDKKQHFEIGDFSARNYELIQDYDPDSKGDGELSCKVA